MKKESFSIASKIQFFIRDLFLRTNYSVFTGKHSKRIYMFHSVCESETNPQEYVCNIDDFQEYIAHISRLRKAVSIYDILKLRGRNLFAVSFDDGFEDIFLYAFPVLRELGVPFTIFITLDYLNKPGYLSTEQLRIMSSSELCTIGSHTFTHPMLRFCDNADYEIRNSRTELEKIIKLPVNLFAYPYGSAFACSNNNIKSVKKSGYKYAFSTLGLPVNIFAKKFGFFIPRINGDPAVLLFKQKMKKN